MKKLTAGQIINIILIFILLIFIGQNLESFPVRFLLLTFELPLIIIILGCFLLGYVTALIMRKNNSEKKDIKDIEE